METQAAYAFRAGKISIRRPGSARDSESAKISCAAFVLQVEESIGEGFEGGNISSHYAEKISSFRSVSAGRDYNAGEACVLQFRDVLR